MDVVDLGVEYAKLLRSYLTVFACRCAKPGTLVPENIALVELLRHVQVYEDALPQQNRLSCVRDYLKKKEVDP